MIWKDPVSRALLSAITLSSVGVGIHLLAMGQLLYDQTGSPEAFALILTLQGVAAFCVLPLCGPLVDSVDSKWVYVGCGVGRAVTVLVIVAIATTAQEGLIPYIMGAAVLLAVFDNVERSALFKFTAHHINATHVVRFNSLIGVAFQAGALSGMALLGLILTWASPADALLVDATMSVLCALTVARIRLPAPEGNPPFTVASLRGAVTGVVGEWRQMLGPYRKEAVVFVMILMCAADFVFAHSLSTLVVPLVDEFYGSRTWYISVLEASFAIGMISASFFSRHLVKQRLLPLWLLTQCGAAVLLSVSDLGAVHFLAFFLGGFANLNSLTWLLTSLQQHAGDGDKAKMASLRLLAIGLGTALLMPLVGRASATSLSVGFGAVAGIMLALTLCAAWISRTYRPRPAVTAPRPTAVAP
ncbi:MFS transporter [Streptomyces sp. NPDC058623]|uniref:MFS transporter n=1 Tax=Streptomyces sp. NPDC058623 TaxID=3346563 RepID=UPI003653B187